MPTVKGFNLGIKRNEGAEYKERVWSLLLNMKIEEEFDVLKNVKEDNRKAFIGSVEDFIFYDNGSAKKFYIEFNTARTKLRKREYSVIQKKETSVNVNEDEIRQLELFFANAQVPNNIKLSEIETIIDAKKFVASHLAGIRSNNPINYMERLRKVQYSDFMLTPCMAQDNSRG